VHHATAGDLDRREMGDVWTMTVEEYLDAPRWKRAGYRLYRNPLIIFTMGAWLSFLVFQRIPNPKDGKRERNSILWTDLALLLIFVAAGLTIGLGDFLRILLPVFFIGTSAGVWLFYVQHQFEGVYWERHQDWSYVDAALKGSSFYQLAEGAAVVLGQHRLPPHPPPQPAHPQLPPGAGLQRERVCSTSRRSRCAPACSR
jgi:omega-6 fatty acid desaturase (delta-12 desaturase)